MSFIIEAKKIWKFKDNIDTDIIIPGRYLVLRDPKEMASHAFEPLNANFAKDVNKGDIIVAGKNFGSGSSREEAPFVLKVLGISAIIAESYARIFFRNAINFGLPSVTVEGVSDMFNDGDLALVNLKEGLVTNLTSDRSTTVGPFPTEVMRILEAGGLVSFLKGEAAKGRLYSQTVDRSKTRINK